MIKLTTLNLVELYPLAFYRSGWSEVTVNEIYFEKRIQKHGQKAIVHIDIQVGKRSLQWNGEKIIDVYLRYPNDNSEITHEIIFLKSSMNSSSLLFRHDGYTVIEITIWYTTNAIWKSKLPPRFVAFIHGFFGISLHERRDIIFTTSLWSGKPSRVTKGPSMIRWRNSHPLGFTRV